MKYTEIQDKVFHCTDPVICEKLTTITLRKEAKKRGYAVGIVKGAKGLQMVCAFFPYNKLEICWTKLDLDESKTCEVIAEFVAARIWGTVNESEIMALFHQIIEMLHKGATWRLLGLDDGSCKGENVYKAMESYLNSGKGEKYNTVLELITR